MHSSARFAFSVTVAIALLPGCGGAQPPIAPSITIDSGAALPHHKTFHYTGSAQLFKVPEGVEKLTIVAHGAAGAGQSGNGKRHFEYFGRGGRVYAIIAVTPGEQLYVFVGGQGSTTGGYNGGGTPGGGDPSGNYLCSGGGGASDVRKHGPGIHSRILVAGGGGGQGCVSGARGHSSVYGGDGGARVGEDGGGFYGADGGGGGSGRGGAGGSGAGSTSGAGGSGQSGALGQGGNGGTAGYYPFCQPSPIFCRGGGGGGGGGGWYGGGGGGGGFGAMDYGSPGAGGGGGSSYVGRAIKAVLWRGWKTATGNGIVVFSWK